MEKSLHDAWHAPVFSRLLASRSESLVLVGVGGALLSLHLLGLPLWACPFKAAFGIPCPGCGLTTAMGELLHGHVLDSLRTHAFAPLFLAAFLLMLVAALLPQDLRARFAGAVSRAEERTAFSAWVLLLLMLYWCVRLFGIV